MLQVLDEISSFINSLSEEVGASPSKEIRLDNHIDVVVGSIINSLLFGYRFAGVSYSILKQSHPGLFIQHVITIFPAFQKDLT